MSAVGCAQAGFQRAYLLTRSLHRGWMSSTAFMSSFKASMAVMKRDTCLTGAVQRSITQRQAARGHTARNVLSRQRAQTLHVTRNGSGVM